MSKSTRRIADDRASGSVLLYAAVGTLFAAVTAYAAESPEQWLEKMARAVETSNYRGTVLRLHGSDVETLRVVHKYEDGQVTEILEALDGAGRTVIRDANGVRCILPESKAVLMERSGGDNKLFARLPGSIARMNGHYDIVLAKQNERVVDRLSVVVALRPHDEYRYGHRLWLDQQTAIPLKTQLLDESNSIVEEMRFADISIGERIPNSEFSVKIDTEGFTFFGTDSERADGRRAPIAKEAHWRAVRLPPGFELRSSEVEMLGDANTPVQHLMYDDGMASVSVFVEAPDYKAGKLSGPMNLGGANAFSVWIRQRQVTAVGEVPDRTVREIAMAIEPGPSNPD